MRKRAVDPRADKRRVSARAADPRTGERRVHALRIFSLADDRNRAMDPRTVRRNRRRAEDDPQYPQYDQDWKCRC